MKHKLVALFLVLGMVLALSASNLNADFVQCPADTGICDGTATSDVINGTNDSNRISGMEGDDTIFGADNPMPSQSSVMSREAVGGLMFGVNYLTPTNNADDISGGPGNDFIAGGPGHDYVYGEAGNDVLMANTDAPMYGQIVDGGADNDTIFVLVGDVTSCLLIFGQTGFDVVNLIGFGPYSAAQAFGIAADIWATGTGAGWIHVVDPIGGGDIYIQVYENGDLGAEIINGLLSPNVTFIPGGAVPALNGCIVPSF